MQSGPYFLQPVLLWLPDDPTWKKRGLDCRDYLHAEGWGHVEMVHGVHGGVWKVSGDSNNIYLLDGRPEEKHFIGQKKVAGYLSHQIMMNVMARMPQDVFATFEDDVLFKPGWKAKLDESLNLLHEVDPGWDVLFAGSCCARSRNPQHVRGDLYKFDGTGHWSVSGPLCNHFVIYRKKCLKHIIATQNDASNPIDCGLLRFSLPALRVYAILPRLADQRDTFLND